MLKYVLSSPVFIMEACWGLSKPFLNLLITPYDLCLYVVYMMYYICLLIYIPSLRLWNKANLIMVDSLLNIVPNLACKYSTKIYLFIY